MDQKKYLYKLLQHQKQKKKYKIKKYVIIKLKTYKNDYIINQ